MEEGGEVTKEKGAGREGASREGGKQMFPD